MSEYEHAFVLGSVRAAVNITRSLKYAFDKVFYSVHMCHMVPAFRLNDDQRNCDEKEEGGGAD